MTVLIPYYLASAAIAAVYCLRGGLHGGALVLGLAAVFLLALVTLMVLTILLYGLVSVFVDKQRPQTRFSAFFTGLFSFALGGICAFCRVRVHLVGAEKLPEGRFLLVCNHRSNFDPIVTGWALRSRRLAFISKPSNFRRPIVGPWMHKACHLPIDREDDRAALRTILTAADYLKRGEVSFCIYPEGTRNPTPELLPFRNGAFKVAQKAGVPIAVAAVRGTDEVKARYPWRHTDVYLNILTVLPAEQVLQMKTVEIGEEVKGWITSASCRTRSATS